MSDVEPDRFDPDPPNIRNPAPGDPELTDHELYTTDEDTVPVEPPKIGG